MGEEYQDYPLSFLFRKCSVTHENLSSIVSSRRDDVLKDIEKIFNAFNNAVDARGIFSSNEDQDDVATGDLKYLFASFYRAEFYSQASSSDPKIRLPYIEVALRSYDTFLSRGNQYSVLGSVGKSTFKAQSEGGGRGLDAGAKRALKIEKFKRDKAIKQRIQVIHDKKKAQKSVDDEDDENSGDDDLERELWLLKLEAASLKALEQQGSLQMEKDMLVQVLKQQDETRTKGSDKERERQQAEDVIAEAEARAAMSEKLRGIAEALQQQGRTRQNLKDEVFRPGFLAPTMTLRELADQEMADAVSREQRQAKAEFREQDRKSNMTEEELDAEEKDKQSHWDDWRDWNPKGAGNSKLKPCG